jgi:hypothetical protein
VSGPHDPDVIRGIERVTGETYDPVTGEWTVPDEPVGWVVTGPDGEVVAAGGQAVVTAVADTGEQET